MQRIKKRKHGRDGDSPRSLGASHVIKIGYDARAKGAKHPKPGKLPGFLICRDTRDTGGNLMVDMGVMGKYGVDADMIQKAKAAQLKPDVAGLLPTELRFSLMHDAIKKDDVWHYPGTFAEEYEAWGSLGLMCSGDGELAKQRQADGTHREIACVPFGKEGCEAKDFCPISAKGDCKGVSRLVLSLFAEDPATERPVPVCESLGWEATYRLDTTSGYNPLRVLAALDAAAERLNGNIAGIPGILSYSIQNKRTGNSQAPVGRVGQLTLTLSEISIVQREQQMWDHKLTAHKHGLEALPVHAAMSTALPAHDASNETPAVEMRVEEEPVALNEPTVVVTDNGDGTAGTHFAEDEDPDPEFPESETPPEEEHSAAMTGLISARDTLLNDFSGAASSLSFELSDQFGVKEVEEIPEERIPEALGVLRAIYREEFNQRAPEGQREGE